MRADLRRLVPRLAAAPNELVPWGSDDVFTPAASGWRRLRVPTSRSRRLPAAAIDFVGLAPHVRLPAASAHGEAALTFPVRHLRATQPAAVTKP